MIFIFFFKYRNHLKQRAQSAEAIADGGCKFKSVKTTEESYNLVKSREKVFELIKERNNLENIDFRTLIVQDNDIPLFLLTRKGLRPKDFVKNTDTLMSKTAQRMNRKSTISPTSSPLRSRTPSTMSKTQGTNFTNRGVQVAITSPKNNTGNKIFFRS